MSFYPAPPVVSKKQWGGKTRVKGLLPLIHPVQHVVLSFYTGVTGCFKSNTCRTLLVELQRQAVKDRRLPDIPYNFMIGYCREIFEARGWNVASDKSLDHPDLYGDRIDIAFIGNWLIRDPKQKCLDLAVELIRYGISREYLDENCKIVQLRDKPVKIEI